MYIFKVHEVNELFKSIRKSEKLGFKRKLLLVYGCNIADGYNLKVNELLELVNNTSHIFRVVRFLAIRKIPYRKNYIHIVIEPISINAISLNMAQLCNVIEQSELRHTVDFEKIMKTCTSSNQITTKIKRKYLFLTIQKIIDDYDPYGLYNAPIDEYDDLSYQVQKILFSTNDYDKKFNDIVRVVVDYSFMDIKSYEEVNALATRLLGIDVSNFGN